MELYNKIIFIWNYYYFILWFYLSLHGSVY